MWIPKLALKVFYNSMLLGLPTLTYNPLNKNSIFHAPVKIDSTSTYINYKIPQDKFNIINRYIKSYNKDLSLIPTRIACDQADYYISINIYNCTSPIFDYINDDFTTRCEINTYVINKKDKLKGTLIMDYVSNMLSLDPDNLFKKKGIINFKRSNNKIMGEANNNKFNLKFNFNYRKNTTKNRLSSKLISYTDFIYYNCGLYDKLFYDSSLIQNNIIKCNDNNVEFKFMNIEFNTVDSVFFFENKINFVGGLWKNIF